MNILIVSFDKSLINKVKEVLKDYNVMDVKNGEEAINTVSSYMDVVIYDAVSGSISEEDINNMYKQKFKDSKYIILVDDLFPVDMNNIMPPKKIKVMRDEVLAKIIDAIVSEPEVVEEQPQDLLSEQLEEVPSGEDLSTYTENMVGFREFDLELPIEPALPQEEGKLHKKLLLVSFDTALINNVREALSEKIDILEAKGIKEALEKAKDADIILFDTISGMLAYRTLMDMSKDEILAKKPYVLLIDELFTIDVESIPLEKKYSFAREAELSKAIEKIIELAEGYPIEHPAEAMLETPPLEEPLPMELEPVFTEEEDKGIMGLLEELVGASVEEEKPPAFVEEEPKMLEEPSIPESISYTSSVEEVPEMREEPVISEGIVHMEKIAESFATALKDLIKEQLSQEKLHSTLLSILSPEEITRQLSSALERKLEEVLREKVNEVLSKVDVSRIVREEAYKVLKERLNELIT